jgi:phospho-N-acetylmuramoyl-pentapeptide-transferase
MLEFQIIRVILFSTLAFILALFCTPILTNFLYKYKLGKKIRNSGDTPIFSQLHAHKAGTPTMGGILIWGTLLILILLFSFLADLAPWEIFKKLNFLSRAETLLPLGVLILSALIGLVDDWLDIRGLGKKGGLSVKHRLLIYTLISGLGAWWFYFKLGWSSFHVPFLGNFAISFWYIPVFMFVIIATAFSVNESDGLDGLAGGSLLTSFASLGVIAFALGKFDLAVFCAVIIGALLAFLWFNIPPARFYMGDTGAMSLGITLGVIAMLTNTALLLPIIGFLFVVESMSVLIQIFSKKFRKKKVFKSAPIHHHFQAIGWSEAKIVMRFWVISAVTAGIGLMIFLVDRSISL